MADIAISVAAKVAEYLVAPISRPFSYLWNYKSNLENLKNEVKKLEGTRDSVQHSVEDASRNGKEIEKHVQSWLDSVNNITIRPRSSLVSTTSSMRPRRLLKMMIISKQTHDVAKGSLVRIW
ncbi:hypothetical protein ACOSP7_008765 [Xanthoceras sorbifolium]